MIIFKSVRYKNLLSTGNIFTEINLISKTTIISGENGAGKSTFLDAICYCLYNNAYRNINKPQLVNTINNKHLLVEVEFTIGGTDYLVRRGQKPNIFEIYQNNKLINQSADTRDYQRMLENNILKMNEKSFRQIVVLGSAVYTPFMKLTPAERRRVIEDILDIQVFSSMNSLLKIKIDTNESELLKIDQELEILEKLLEAEKQHQQQLKENHEELINVKSSKIDEYIKINAELFTKKESLYSDIKELETKINPKIKERYEELISIKKKAEDQISKLEKELLFFNSNCECPTCKQDIPKTFRDDYLLSLHEKQQRLKSKYDGLLNKIEKILIELEKQKEIQLSIDKINNIIKESDFQININKKFIESFKREIKELKSRSSNISNSRLSPFVDKTNTIKLINQRKNVVKKREIYGYASLLLKDTGIKARIIKQYVPIINQLINDNLKKLEFYIDFNLDETFRETILSRGRDNFSYFSFSEGEKMRIDMAILFTWREIAKLKRSTNTNLLILDEIFDSSLDQKGIDEYIRMIHLLSEDTNIFIISPKAEFISDKFDKIITFKKIKNFSKMVEGD